MPSNSQPHQYETLVTHCPAENEAELRIELNRPATMNAWNLQLGIDLRAALERAAIDDTVAVVTITGSGRAFSSGADLGARLDVTATGRPDVRRALRERYHPVILALRELPKPVIAAVNGPAVGIGCSLALACDLIVAKQSAYFMLSFVHLGLMPDGGCSVFLPQRIGAARSAEMAFLGERVQADQALQWGLINRVVDDNEFATQVAALALQLTNGPTASYAATKRALNASIYRDLASQLELESELQEGLAASPVFATRVAAFLAQRTPK